MERERRKKYQKNVGLLDKISIVRLRGISKISHEKSRVKKRGDEVDNDSLKEPTGIETLSSDY